MAHCLNPFFAVNAVRRKNNTAYGKRGQLRYETYTVDQEIMELDLESNVFPFMDVHE